MATLWEKAAHLANRVFSLICQFVGLVVSHFGFGDRTLVLISSVPGHFLPFTFCKFIQQITITRISIA